MRIIADAFGGDNAPLEILKGCRDAVSELSVDILLTGDKEKIEHCAAENGISLDRMEILHAPDVFLMEDEPKEILKGRSESSMAAGLRALAEGKGDAFVSAGSTGALVVGATFIVKRIKGIKRIAIGSVIPSSKGPVLLLDAGANAECHAEYLAQFAQMGHAFMQNGMGIKNPKTGLANIGTEPTKGDTLRLEAFSLLSSLEGINFAGNIEARDIAYGECDVVVADGFTGNIMIKMYEGVAGALLKEIKGIYSKNFVSKLSYLAVKPGFSAFRHKMDYKEYGGAPLLGVNGTVVKAHGSCDARAFKNAIRQATQAIRSDVTGCIAQSV